MLFLDPSKNQKIVLIAIFFFVINSPIQVYILKVFTDLNQNE